MKIKQDAVLKTGWLVVACLFILGGCTTTAVQPWERGVLAKEELVTEPVRDNT